MARLLLALLLLAACTEATPRRHRPVSDQAGDSDPGDPLQLGGGLSVTTATASFAGELVAVYDHSRWWHDPTDELTLGLFQPTGLAEYPDDRSMAFVSSTAILSLTPASTPFPSYREALRDRGILLDRLPLDGVAYVITGNESYHREEDGFGDFAWDFERTDAVGQRYQSSGFANEDFLVWDAEVYLPTAGYVIEVVGDAPDNLPGAYPEGAVNNIVGLHLYGAFYLYLFHFRQGTIPAGILPGAVLPAGTYLGRVGNSGVSLEPHLHLTLYWYDGERTSRSWSVPGEFVDLHWSTSPTGPSQAADFFVPETGTWVSDSPF